MPERTRRFTQKPMRQQAASVRAKTPLARGRYLYAIGDIHGRYDLLLNALDFIEAHSGKHAADITFLGDYIDRGPDSRSVVELLMSGPRRAGDRFDCLLGNHEQLCFDAQASLAAHRVWMRNGGEATIKSYAGEIPTSHLKWMAQLPIILEAERHFFVHAGFDPRVAIEAQSKETCLWIRDEFLDANHDFGKHVVHGHTPDGPKLKPYRTNLDGSAFSSNFLCVGLIDAEQDGGPIAVQKIGVEGKIGRSVRARTRK